MRHAQFIDGHQIMRKIEDNFEKFKIRRTQDDDNKDEQTSAVQRWMNTCEIDVTGPSFLMHRMLPQASLPKFKFTPDWADDDEEEADEGGDKEDDWRLSL